MKIVDSISPKKNEIKSTASSPTNKFESSISMWWSAKSLPSGSRRTKVANMRSPNKINTVWIVDIVVDAFVALGGNPDKSGQVKKSAIETVKKEFELTFDIELLVDSAGDSLDYTAFKSIFEQEK
jgi:hypothetical protein